MTSDTFPERVAFEFADRELVGDVVDQTSTATYNHSIATLVTVEHDGSRYRVPASQTSTI